MKKNILSVFTIICVALLFYILFIQKSSEGSYVFLSVLAFVIVFLTFLNTGKDTVEKE